MQMKIPGHTVYLDAFWIDKTDVTFGMYNRCVQAGSCQQPYATNSLAHVIVSDNPNNVDFPVYRIEWSQASAYCQWAGVGLPTEAEWEKAARGTDGRTYPWGNSSPTCSLANYTNWYPFNSCNNGVTTVDSHLLGASPYGVLDMAGNVWQWVADWYAKYSKSDQINPQGPVSGQYRVLRGGSFGFSDFVMRSTNRVPTDPTGFYYGYIGFRCASSKR